MGKRGRKTGNGVPVDEPRSIPSISSEVGRYAGDLSMDL